MLRMFGNWLANLRNIAGTLAPATRMDLATGRTIQRRLHRCNAIEALRREYLHKWVEDPQDGTDFDCAILDALERLEKLA